MLRCQLFLVLFVNQQLTWNKWCYILYCCYEFMNVHIGLWYWQSVLYIVITNRTKYKNEIRYNWANNQEYGLELFHCMFIYVNIQGLIYVNIQGLIYVKPSISGPDIISKNTDFETLSEFGGKTVEVKLNKDKIP